MNKLFIIGNLTRDIVINQTASGTKYAKFTVAVNQKGTDNECDFFEVTAWKEIAENCGKFLKKGSKVAISGPIHFRSYVGSDSAKRQTAEVTAYEVEFLSRIEQSNDALTPINDEELPF